MDTKRKAVAMAMGMLIIAAYVYPAFAQQKKEEPSLIVIANEASYALAKDFITFLTNESVPVVHVKAPEFPTYQKEKYIVVLGGPSESDGIGDIVKQLLTKEEQEWVSQPGNRRMYMKNDVWQEGQRIIVFAGSDPEAVAKARVDNRDKWLPYIGAWFNIETRGGFQKY